jgi:hypothetical protein
MIKPITDSRGVQVVTQFTFKTRAIPGGKAIGAVTEA